MSAEIKSAEKAEDKTLAVVPLVHELAEALTATGNYLTAATRVLEAHVDPPGMTLEQVLQRGNAQFARAIDAFRELRAALLHSR